MTLGNKKKQSEPFRLSKDFCREAGLGLYFKKGLRSDEELKRFLEYCLGITIPDKQICPDHQAPFSFISDVFFGRVVDAVVWACRSGGKSFNEALLTFLGW